MTIASLPMYDLEPLREATDAWWRAIATALRCHGFRDVPDTLDRGDFGDRFDHWSSPDLLLSQTCGYPLTHDFADKVRLVAIPFYSAPHTVSHQYCSVVMVRDDDPATSIGDLRGKRAAVNGFDSQSGFNALRATVAPHARGGRFFSKVIETGHHHASLRKVAEGEADVCAIDCVSHALWCDTMPERVAGTRLLTTTPLAPNLPYVTHIGRRDEEVEAMQLALVEASGNTDVAEARKAVRLAGFNFLPASVYHTIEAMEQQAAALGYPDLA
ncbi:MAG: PhnD/SsuA/transferrin family substrate-binding protein [Rhodospirillales bacterium]|nr:PhnD/SsuA/transferrin family substrate-binding protein [Rhodospirillales bacterium]